MLRQAVLLGVVALLASPVLGDDPPEPEPVQGACEPEYECSYEYTDAAGVTYFWDLSELCHQNGGYFVQDQSQHSYSFNLCGISSYRCVPKDWANVYEYGIAVQYWGAKPPCNQTAPDCQNYDGSPTCCSEACQVLGTGAPEWFLKDNTNPERGGIQLKHRGVPPSNDDPHWCPWNANTGAQYERTVVYDIACNHTMKRGEVQILGAHDNTTFCEYTIYLSSWHGCGCAPNCVGKNCGSDGCYSTCSGISINNKNGCPQDYECLEDGVCCRPDCKQRTCGPDGCGGNCNSAYDGGCPDGNHCVNQNCVPNVAPTPSPHYTYSDDPGTVAASFFAGLFATVAVGAVGIWWYRRRGGGSYSPFFTGSAGSTTSAPATQTAPTTSTSSSGYGAL